MRASIAANHDLLPCPKHQLLAPIGSTFDEESRHISSWVTSFRERGPSGAKSIASLFRANNAATLAGVMVAAYMERKIGLSNARNLR